MKSLRNFHELYFCQSLNSKASLNLTFRLSAGHWAGHVEVGGTEQFGGTENPPKLAGRVYLYLSDFQLDSSGS